MLEHVGVPREKSTARSSADAALDLHYRHWVIREAPEESSERSSGEVAASLAFAVQLRFPAALDVDHGQCIVQRTEAYTSPAGGLEEFRCARREFVDPEIFRSSQATLAEPYLERIEE